MLKNGKIYQILMLVVSFWVPLAGILLLFLTAKNYPELRKKIIIATLLGFVVNFGLTICKQNGWLWFSMIKF